jgi:rubrerythrin
VVETAEPKTLRAPRDLYEALKQARDRSAPGFALWRMTAFWPRCPGCGAPLLQKFASHRLVCPLCGKEFELLEAVGNG